MVYARVYAGICAPVQVCVHGVGVFFSITLHLIPLRQGLSLTLAPVILLPPMMGL